MPDSRDSRHLAISLSAITVDLLASGFDAKSASTAERTAEASTSPLSWDDTMDISGPTPLRTPSDLSVLQTERPTSMRATTRSSTLLSRGVVKKLPFRRSYIMRFMSVQRRPRSATLGSPPSSTSSAHLETSSQMAMTPRWLELTLLPRFTITLSATMNTALTASTSRRSGISSRVAGSVTIEA